MKYDQLQGWPYIKSPAQTHTYPHTHTRMVSTHRVSHEVLCVSQSCSGLQLHVVATFGVGGGWRLSQIREVLSRPGASEADLVQAL